MMSRNVRGFMSLFHRDTPVVCKVHGFCVAGGTDVALCSALLDGVARHPAEGYAFERRAEEVGFKQAVKERDEPFGDVGRSTFEG
jgi:hypothetical protein